MKRSIAFSLTFAVILVFGLALPLDLSAQNQSLADQVSGEFKGKLRNQTSDLSNYKIKITKVSDDTVKIQPKIGSSSQTFEVKLTEQVAGEITMIKFKMPGDNIMNNGMFIQSNGRLSYSIHLGGDNPRNLEVFSGKKN